ncbi:uncharacterized protein SAPINGB_P002231 [Magnusiomyces paraingens]|uniref:Uncharacterized protein n=1 Tax=Magnusiomyces paraingens TaxID=2606893 RepID=A0A5E8BKS6_9ASCO|nr:uncharacterized protein SAPINGB_P002231 [Saprochaete ingens]VVT49358.1 unnamed protein product [Saprochaete ingens]
MVAINKLSLLNSLVLSVSASPIGNPEAVAVAVALPNGDSNDITGSTVIIKRESVSGVADLIDSLVKFLLATLGNLPSLDLASESKDFANLLVIVNKDLLQIENDLKSFGLTSGLGTLLQSTFISTGLQFLVLTLSTFVANLVSKLATGHSIDPDVAAQLSQLKSQIAGLKTQLQTFGLLGTLDSAVASIVHCLEGLLS